MLFRNRKYRAGYDAELLKQTDPYEYYIRYEESAGDRKLTGPPFYTISRGNYQGPGRPEDLSKGDPRTIEVLQRNYQEYKIWLMGDYYIFCDGEGILEKKVMLKSLLPVHTGDLSLDIPSHKSPVSPLVELVYFDHDYITSEDASDPLPEDRRRIRPGQRHSPYFKPEWSYDTFMHVPYMEEIFAVKKELMESEEAINAMQRFFTVTELLHWVLGRGCSVAHVDEIGCHIITEYLSSEKLYESYVRHHTSPAKARLYRELRESANYAAALERYRISVIIPSRDHSEILQQCLKSIIDKTRFNKLDLEIIIVDNGSSEEEKTKITDIINDTREVTKLIAGSVSSEFDIRYFYEPMTFNFSRMCDIGARASRFEYLLFLNDDIELKDRDALELLCNYAAMEDTGAVGCKLYYPGTHFIQHDGITDLSCGPSHKLARHDDQTSWYFGANRFNRNVLAVTGACLMIKKEKYFNLGGFNDKMEVSYNDVELCLKCIKKGLRNIVLNDLVMYHHESLLRGADHINDEKYKRLVSERELLYRENEWLVRTGDPCYSRKLICDTLDYKVNVQPAYENRTVRSEIRELSERETARLRKKDHDRHIRFYLESAAFERGMGREETNFIRIEGWMLHDRRDNACLQRSLFLLREGEEGGIEISMLPRYRKDVRKAFPKAKRAELAGFVCKVPIAFLKRDGRYEPIPCLRTAGGGRLVGIGKQTDADCGLSVIDLRTC
ncbi:MAG: glycosyltransferase [Lachnospiraceae bacterium]|nr:glycosyltransferase [Lachnospiraceae bacterium]